MEHTELVRSKHHRQLVKRVFLQIVGLAVCTRYHGAVIGNKKRTGYGQVNIITSEIIKKVLLARIETNERKGQLGWISRLGMVAAVGPNVKRIRVIDDILIDKRKGGIDFGHGPPTEPVVGARLTCVCGGGGGGWFRNAWLRRYCFAHLISMLFKGKLAFLVLASLAVAAARRV